MNLTTRRREPGFTLVELLVVIAIISVIAGLLLGGVAFVKQGAKESQAQAVLTNLMGNAGQYETKTTKPVDHILSSIIVWGGPRLMNAPDSKGDGIIQAAYVNDANNGNPSYDSGKDNDFYMERANLYIERFIWAANQIPEIRDNLPSLGGAFDDIDGDGFMEILDPWGNPIAYASRVTHLADPDDDFLPTHDSPFFASAGKDQRWGLPKKRGEFTNDALWQTYKASDEYKFSLDNLYSFDLDRSTAQRED